jgi:hypothetical protein
MKVYTYLTTSTYGDVVATGSTRVWIGAIDGLLYRSETETQSSALSGEKSKTVIVYEYDPNIRIQAPL